ncbi:MAG TPA: AraC family transcriptional regulator [Polyangiales bacterium]|nr:AraC family transcriptional regulator [Polyangiales bacterium]
MTAAATSNATTSIRLVWPFLELSRKHGRDVSRVAERLGLTQAELDNPETRVPQALVADLLKDAVERSGERDIGLLAARWSDSLHFGIGEYVARTRPTLRSALDLYARYLPLLGDGAGFEFEDHGQAVSMRIWFSPELVIHEAAYEFAVAIGVLRARRIAGKPDMNPVSVNFMHARPQNTSRHERLFRCPVYFGAETTHVVVPREHLELRLPGAEPVLNDLLARQADAMLDRLPRADDVASRVRTLLGGELELTEASAPRIAKRLGMSVRTLSRRLDDEGTSFREVIDDVRKHVALRELTHDSRTLAELAARLGFASTQGFHRAFRRWTGTTAASVRKDAREGRGRASTA